MEDLDGELIACHNCGDLTPIYMFVHSIKTYVNPSGQDLPQEPWCLECIVNAGAPIET